MISVMMVGPTLGADLFCFCRFSWTLVRIRPAYTGFFTPPSQHAFVTLSFYSFGCSRLVALLHVFISCPHCSLFLADINYGEYSTDAPATIFDLGDWLFDLLDVSKCPSFLFLWSPSLLPALGPAFYLCLSRCL